MAPYQRMAKGGFLLARNFRGVRDSSCGASGTAGFRCGLRRAPVAGASIAPSVNCGNAKANGTEYAGATFTRGFVPKYLGAVNSPVWFRGRWRLLAVAVVPLATSYLLHASSLVAAPPNVKGKIIGQEKLVVDVYAEAANPSSKRWSWREPSVAVDAKFRNLSPQITREICLVAANNGQNSPDAASLLVKVTGGRTNPVTIVVRPETTLEFLNADPFEHLLTFVGRPETLKMAGRPALALQDPGRRAEDRDPRPRLPEHSQLRPHRPQRRAIRVSCS